MTDETMNTEQSRVAADCPNERLVMPILHFVAAGSTPRQTENKKWEYRQNVATLGRFLPLTLADLRRYVRQYPLAWVTA